MSSKHSALEAKKVQITKIKWLLDILSHRAKLFFQSFVAVRSNKNLHFARWEKKSKNWWFLTLKKMMQSPSDLGNYLLHCIFTFSTLCLSKNVLNRLEKETTFCGVFVTTIALVYTMWLPCCIVAYIRKILNKY